MRSSHLNRASWPGDRLPRGRVSSPGASLAYRRGIGTSLPGTLDHMVAGRMRPATSPRPHTPHGRRSTIPAWKARWPLHRAPGHVGGFRLYVRITRVSDEAGAIPPTRQVTAMGRLSIAALVAGLVVLLGGCAPRACTEIGCASGLSISIANPPGGAYHLQVDVPGERTRVVQCGDAEGGCASGTFFLPETTPAQLTVRVVSAGKVIDSKTVRPSYDTFRPNGPGCPPLCRTARIQLGAR